MSFVAEAVARKRLWTPSKALACMIGSDL